MMKVYVMILVLGVVGGTGYMAYSEYKDMQERIGVLRENNAKLETALETSEASINNLQSTMESLAEANRTLQSDLQKAEKYGDDLRNKLRQLDLVQDAIKDAAKLEGKMNGATAKLWREIIADTGGIPDHTLPEWLQSNPNTRTESEGSDESRESPDTNSSKTETSTTD